MDGGLACNHLIWFSFFLCLSFYLSLTHRPTHSLTHSLPRTYFFFFSRHHFQATDGTDVGDWVKKLLAAPLAEVKDGIAVLRSAELELAADQLKSLLSIVPVIMDIEVEAERRSELEEFKHKAQQAIDHAQVRTGGRTGSERLARFVCSIDGASVITQFRFAMCLYYFRLHNPTNYRAPSERWRTWKSRFAPWKLPSWRSSRAAFAARRRCFERRLNRNYQNFWSWK